MKKLIVTAIVLMFSLYTHSFSTDYKVENKKRGWVAEKTSDNGYITIRALSDAKKHFEVTKFDQSWNQVWTKVFDNNYNGGIEVIDTKSGSLLIAKLSKNKKSLKQFYCIRIDHQGNLVNNLF